MNLFLMRLTRPALACCAEVCVVLRRYDTRHECKTQLTHIWMTLRFGRLRAAEKENGPPVNSGCPLRVTSDRWRTRLMLVDVELLGVKGRIGLDQDGLADHLLHLLEPAGAGILERLDDLRMDAQHDVATAEMLVHLAHLDVDVVADGDGRLDHTGADADVAGGGEGALERLFDALAGDGDQAKIVELENLGWGAVGLEFFLKSGHDL